jgi:hypothetical protein
MLRLLSHSTNQIENQSDSALTYKRGAKPFHSQKLEQSYFAIVAIQPNATLFLAMNACILALLVSLWNVPEEQKNVVNIDALGLACYVLIYREETPHSWFTTESCYI